MSVERRVQALAHRPDNPLIRSKSILVKPYMDGWSDCCIVKGRKGICYGVPN